MIDFKGSHFETEIIMWGIRWYVSSPISYRQLEDVVEEGGVAVAHATLNREVIAYAPEVAKQRRRSQCPVGRRRRLLEDLTPRPEYCAPDTYLSGFAAIHLR